MSTGCYLATRNFNNKCLDDTSKFGFTVSMDDFGFSSIEVLD